MATQFSIRRADTSDIPALNKLMQESSAYQDDYSAMLRGYSVSPEQVAADEVYVAHQAGDILGFYSLTNVATCPELDLMFVANEALGKKVGATLFEHMSIQAVSLGAEAVKIVSHPSAEGFYLRMGAKKVGVQAPSARVTWERPVLVLRTKSN